MIEETLFPVKEVPAIGYKVTESGHKFIVREDTGDVLSCVSNSYKLINNQDVYNKALPVLEKNKCELVEAQSFSNGARTTWKWRFPETKVEIGKGDFVNPEIIIRNSYDGSTEASAMAGAFRLVCTNGLVIGHILSRNGIRHIVGNTGNFEELVENTIRTTNKVFTQEFPMLVSTKIRKKHIENLVKMFPGTVMETLVQHIIAKPPETYWDLLNAATWISTHSMSRSREATHKIENKIYPEIHRLAKSVAKA
ncbi:hypothetical protein CMI37_01835 [Candidatus Pacearchaeota archaeon]|nr:hypothetical protein [Candidatus Pacearchaeota archaeon]|tara:strand:+ start:1340 stop:2095 length:756 start_codon:yes stop_codon:yes gene_type:complete